MPTLFLPRLFATTGVVRLSGLRSQTAEGSLEGRVRHAATGQSLGNARVLVPGSPLVAYSDEVGAFRLAHVPVSPVTRAVFFTGLDVRRIPLALAAGQTLVQAIDLISVARFGQPSETVKRAACVVSST
jgi:hypothetical protein